MATTIDHTKKAPSSSNPDFVSFGDTSNIDAFGRLRVSQITTLFDAKQLHDKLPLFIDEVLNGATATHSTTNSETSLASALTGEYAVMQTFQRFNYQSGKSQLMFMTFSDFHVQTNIEKRIGYFSAQITTPWYGTYDGIFLENDGIDVSIRAYRSGTSTHNIPQSSWDDSLDGTGASGITVDWEKANILALDFEWLGVGRIRWCLVINGAFIPFHYINNANLTDNVYMSSPNQPLRWEMVQTGAGSGSFNYICASVNSEGSLNQVGKDGGIDDDGTHLDANSTSTWYYAIGLKLKAANLDSIIDVLSLVLKSDTNDDFVYRVVLNPTYAGASTYTAVTNYGVEYKLGVTANTVSASGTILKSGFGDANTTIDADLKSAIRMGAGIKGTVDELVIIVKPHSSNLDIHRAINWRELT